MLLLRLNASGLLVGMRSEGDASLCMLLLIFSRFKEFEKKKFQITFFVVALRIYTNNFFFAYLKCVKAAESPLHAAILPDNLYYVCLSRNFT